MQRVLVLGSGGAGKSTFSAQLARVTQLPLLHLDALYWKPGWVESSKNEWAATVAELVRGERWIMDGNYGGTLAERIEACDTVIFLDMPRHVCLWRVLKRFVRYRGRTRPDMREGCNEQLTFEFLVWIWNYPKARRPAVLQRMRTLTALQRGVRLRSPGDIAKFLDTAIDGEATNHDPLELT